MKALTRFFHTPAAGGIVLMMSAVLAMLAANTAAAPLYGRFVDSGHLVINDFLMAVFFLLAGLEIKREIVAGALSTRASASLPLIAAFCGMLAPAAVYLFATGGAPDLHAGWAIPAATDIAFALGVLALLGSRMPPALKILLLAVAVIDDLGAILVIVFFYSGGLYLPALAAAGAAALGLVLLNRRGVQAAIPYMILALLLWGALFRAGVHPTLAGVMLGFCVPMAVLPRWQHAIEPWVVFGVLPLFGFSNAGVSLAGIGLRDLAHPVTLGIGLGLFAGKQLGIFASIWLAVRTGICRLPDALGWAHIYGLSLLCGIGFTMSLFIGALAFDDPSMSVYVRMGVIGGSVLSALLGYTVLSCAGSHSKQGLSK